MRGNQVRDLGRIHARATADGDEAVYLMLDRKVRGILKRLDRRLDAGAVVDHDLDSFGLNQALDSFGMPELGDAGISDEHRALYPEPLELPPGLL